MLLSETVESSVGIMFDYPADHCISFVPCRQVLYGRCGYLYCLLFLRKIFSAFSSSTVSASYTLSGLLLRTSGSW